MCLIINAKHCLLFEPFWIRCASLQCLSKLERTLITEWAKVIIKITLSWTVPNTPFCCLFAKFVLTKQLYLPFFGTLYYLGRRNKRKLLQRPSFATYDVISVCVGWGIVRKCQLPLFEFSIIMHFSVCKMLKSEYKNSIIWYSNVSSSNNCVSDYLSLLWT